MATPPRAGYSGTPLIGKLGYKPGQFAVLIGVPDTVREAMEYPDFERRIVAESLESLPGDLRSVDVVNFFTKERATLEAALPVLRRLLRPAGMIWVSWPKKASKVPTDVTEDVIRDLALSIDLVDVKVCAVDLVWSGLKLVIPVSKRPAG